MTSGVFFIFAGVILDSMNYSIRRLEARILGLRSSVPSSVVERGPVQVTQPNPDVTHQMPSELGEPQPIMSPTLLIGETISIRSAIASVLRDADYSVRSPAILRGASGIEYNFDIVASREDETWVFDICTDASSSGTGAVFSLFAKVLDVKPERATLLATPRISPQAEKLAEMYKIQVVGGNSPAQLREVIHVLTSGSSKSAPTLEAYDSNE